MVSLTDQLRTLEIRAVRLRAEIAQRSRELASLDRELDAMRVIIGYGDRQEGTHDV